MKESNVVPEPSSDVDEDELKVVQPSSEVIETQDAGLKSDKTDVINLAEDSIVVLDGPSENETETQDAVEEKYELQKLNFKDIKELDLFLLQPTNSGTYNFFRSQISKSKHNLYRIIYNSSSMIEFLLFAASKHDVIDRVLKTVVLFFLL